MLPPSEAKSAGADDEVGRETLAVVEWTADDREDNWLISYADLLSVIFTMVVLLFGRMTVVAQTPAVEEPASEVVAHTTDAPEATPAVHMISEPAAAPKPVAESAAGQSAVAPDVGAAAVATPDLVANDSAPPGALAQDESLPLPESSSREDRVADLIEQRFRGQIAATR